MTGSKLDERAEGDGERRVLGIADYLDQFDRSPYSYPACDYASVEGASTMMGAWFQHPRQGGEGAGREPNSPSSDPG